MKEKALILLEGHYKDYKNNETKQLGIIGILEPTTGIFKGVEIPKEACDITDAVEVLNYISQGYNSLQNFPLVAGYYDGKTLEYRNLLVDRDIVFGHFELDEEEKRFLGREKEAKKGRLVRSLNRLVNRYDTVIFLPQLLNCQSKLELTKYLIYIYEFIEAILMKATNDMGWRGLQFSIENMAPKTKEKTYMITPSADEVKQ